MKTKSLLCILIIVLFATPLLALELPQPQGTVNDFAGMIDSASQQNIESLIREIRDKTTVEIAVVTVETLNGAPKEQYAIELAQKWGVGKKEKDNGILILIAKQEREYRIEIGRGLEGSINDAKAGRIARQVLVPNFKRGEYGKGLFETLLAIKGLLENNKEISVQYSEQNNSFGILTFLFFLVSYVIFTVCLGKKIKWVPLAGWNILTILTGFFYGVSNAMFLLLITAFVFALFSKFGSHNFGGFTGRGFGGGSGSFGGGFGGGSFGGGGAGGRW